ncbi:protein kinase 4-like [Drosophila yakuba]|uniref:protein kinase 4-like n=1 Tax=Drosophila yakuba TaxID=7245 RepID=UPI0019308629|nr:protein kinase 4-like [Drosophila yakuba]
MKIRDTSAKRQAQCGTARHQQQQRQQQQPQQQNQQQQGAAQRTKDEGGQETSANERETAQAEGRSTGRDGQLSVIMR